MSTERELAVEFNRRIMNGETIEAAEHSFVRKDGTVGYHAFTARPIVSGGRIVGVEGFMFDISPRVEAEKELLRTRRLLEDAMRLGKMAAWGVYLAENTIRWRGDVQSILETDGQIPHNVAEGLHFCHPEDMPALEAKVDRAVKENEHFHLRLRLLTATGSEKWAQIAGFPVVNNGQVTHVIGMLQDIEEHKRAEQLLESQLKEKELLVREVHHRVKNNMASVESLLMFQADSVESPEAQAALREAMSRVASTRRVYDQLLSATDHEIISVRGYIEELLESITIAFGVDSGIDVATEIDDATIDPKRLFVLGTIINEVVTNAIKYAFSDTGRGQIKLRLSDDGERLSLQICDNGKGLPDGFDIANPPGLGTMLISLMVEQLGGTLNVESTTGSCWNISFPK